VSDLVSFVVGGINEDLSGVYNVGSGQGVSLKDVLSLIEEISGVSANVKYLSPRGFDVKKVVLDISKARKALDWEPLVPLREGCERYWKWAKG
jgi:UDP-glucose 4-epimerase